MSENKNNMKINLGNMNSLVESEIKLKFVEGKLVSIDYGELCLVCKRTTQIGSGLYVNRIPAGWDSSMGDDGNIDQNNNQEVYSTEGWLCPDCLKEIEQPTTTKER